MQHPMDYTTTPFGACHVMVVDAGTTIKDERTGREETVTKDSAVTKGSMIYCTQSVFDQLKARIA